MKRLLLYVLLVLIFGPFVYAQSNTGDVVGQVFDPQKALVPDADVRIASEETGFVETSKTNETGNFGFHALQPGTYGLIVHKNGFETEIIKELVVSTAKTTTANITLQLGLAQTTVEITSNSLVTPDSAMLSTTVDSQLLQEIPFNDRSSLSSVMLVAGVQGDPQFPGGIQNENPGVYLTPVVPGASLAVAGGRPGSASILVDSSDNTLTTYPRTGVTFSGVTIQEITVQQNGLPAQFGRTAGGIINQTTRGGADKLHGELSWLHEDPSTEAYTYGSPFRRGRHVNYFGAMLSGPVEIPHYDGRHHQTYFFADVEPTRGTDENWAEGHFITPQELAGNFHNSLELLNQTTLATSGYTAAINGPRAICPLSTNATQPCGIWFKYNAAGTGPYAIFPGPNESSSKSWYQIPGDDLSYYLAQNPIARFVYGFFPTPQNPSKYVAFYNPDASYSNNGTNAYLVRGVDQKDNRFSIRVDHALSATDYLMARYTYVPVDGIRYGEFGPDSPVNTIPRDKIGSINAVLGEVHTFRSSVNEFHMTYTRADEHRTPPPQALQQDWGALIGLKAASLGAGFPSLGGFSNGNVGSGGAVLSNGHTLDVNLGITDNFSFQRGRHSFKIGADVRFLQQNRFDTSNLNGGDYGFDNSNTDNNGGGSASASFVLGIVNSYTSKLTGIPFYYRWQYYAGYIQDDWRAFSRITFNLGVRYNVETPRYEKFNHQGYFDPSTDGTLNGVPALGGFVFSGENGRSRYMWPINFKEVEPRVGVAYAVKPNITLRASYSIVHPGLTGLGANVNPDLSAAQTGFSTTDGGLSNGQVNYLTNPVGSIPTHLPLSGGPLFTWTNQTNLPYVEQKDTVPMVQLYSFSLQYGISKNSILEVAYSGQHAVHLFSVPIAKNLPPLPALLNAIQNGTDLTSTTTLPNMYGLGNNMDGYDELLPYQQFYTNEILSAYSRDNDSHYNALYVTGRERMGNHLTALGSFSWSKSMDDGSSGSTDLSNPTDTFGLSQVQNPYAPLRAERALSTFDIPLKGSIAVRYSAPIFIHHTAGWRKVPAAMVNGWMTTANYIRQSGYPLLITLGTPGYFFSVVASGNDAGRLDAALGDSTLRPNLMPGVPLINSNWKRDPFNNTGKGGYVNPNAFTTPGSYLNPAFGNMPRTLGNLRNPVTQYCNLKLSKVYVLDKNEGVRMVFYSNILNALNHANFFEQNGNVYKSYTFSPSTPNPTVTTTQNLVFGNMSQTNITPGREIQFGLRLQF